MPNTAGLSQSCVCACAAKLYSRTTMVRTLFIMDSYLDGVVDCMKMEAVGRLLLMQT